MNIKLKSVLSVIFKFTETGDPGDLMVHVQSRAAQEVRREDERVPTQPQGILEEIVPVPLRPLEVVPQEAVQVSINNQDNQ
jgi:hypothetical protein